MWKNARSPRRARAAAAGLLALVLVPSTVLCLEDVPAVPPVAVEDLPWSSPVLLVGDVDAAADWYRRALGFEVVGERVDGDSRTLLSPAG